GPVEVGELSRRAQLLEQEQTNPLCGGQKHRHHLKLRSRCVLYFSSLTFSNIGNMFWKKLHPISNGFQRRANTGEILITNFAVFHRNNAFSFHHAVFANFSAVPIECLLFSATS